MINVKKVQGSALQAAPKAATVEATTEWLWRVTASKGGVVHQITTRSFETMQGIIALRRRAGWAVSHRIKVRRG